MQKNVAKWHMQVSISSTFYARAHFSPIFLHQEISNPNVIFGAKILVQYEWNLMLMKLTHAGRRRPTIKKKVLHTILMERKNRNIRMEASK